MALISRRHGQQDLLQGNLVHLIVDSIMKFTTFPILTTENLILRQFEMADEKEVFLLRSSDEVNKFIDRPRASSIDDARSFIEKITDKNNKEAFIWAIERKEKKGLVGSVCLLRFTPENNSCEVGYEMLPDFQGKGIVQEALKKILEYGFETLGLSTINAVIHPDNIKSIKLAERFGFRRTGQLEEKFLIYSLRNLAG